MGDLKFSEKAWDEYIYWQTQDKKTLKRINMLLKEIQRTPFAGRGKPEQLKGDLSGNWSRRINEADRLVYQVTGDEIQIIQCRGHYDDK